MKSSAEIHPFRGSHIFGEMYGVEPTLLNDENALLEHFQKAIKASGAKIVGLQVRNFAPSGVTILAMLAESHASLHTYPEFSSLFFDAFTCGDHCHPDKIVQSLVVSFAPRVHRIKRLDRGVSDDSLVHLHQA